MDIDKIREHIIDCIFEYKEILASRPPADKLEVAKLHVFVNTVQLVVKENETNEDDVNFIIDVIKDGYPTCKICDW